MVTLCLWLRRAARLFSKAATTIAVAIRSGAGLLPLHVPPALAARRFYTPAVSVGARWLLLVVLIGTSLMMSDAPVCFRVHGVAPWST